MKYDSFVQKEKVKDIIAKGLLDPVYAMLPVDCYAPEFTAYLKNKDINVIDYLIYNVPTHCFSTYWDDDCELTATIRLNNSITEIKDSAFKWNRSFKKIFLPADLERVGEEAFDSCDDGLIFIYPKGVDYLKNVEFRSNWAGGVSYIIECSDGMCKVAENGTVKPIAKLVSSNFQSTP